MEALTLDEAVAALAAKAAGGGGGGRMLGEHPDGGPITVRDGRFGAYVNWGRVNATIPKSIALDAITLQDAIELIAEREGKPAKPARNPRRQRRRGRPSRRRRQQRRPQKTSPSRGSRRRPPSGRLEAREEGGRGPRAIDSRKSPLPSLNALLPTHYCLPPIAIVEP